MAKTPINELVETIKLVRDMKETLDSLVDVVESLSNRLLLLEQRASPGAAPTGE